MTDTEKKVAPSTTNSGLSRIPLSNLPDSQPEEAAVLASMVIDPRVIPDVREILPHDSFFADRDHRIIWRLILLLYERNAGRGVDGLLLRNELETCPELSSAATVDYLERMLQTVPSAANAVYYAKLVREKAIRRNLIDVGREIVGIAGEQGDMSSLADRAQTALARACEGADYQEQTVDCMSALQAAYSDLERKTKPKLPITYMDLASLLPGFMAGQLIVIGGRPRQGKTALAQCLISRAFLHPQGGGYHVLFISFEMTCSDLMKRALSFVSGVPFTSMSRQMLTLDDFKKISAAMSAIQPWDLHFADRIAPVPSSVRNTARRLHRRKALDALVIDYAQRMHCAEKRATRDWEMSVISNEMKNLALELQIPVILISQLNRDCDKREDHRPRLSDLRDSGTLEQDADVILLVYRPGCYEADRQNRSHIAEIAVAKQRNGPEGVAELIFFDSTMSFENKAWTTTSQTS